MYRVTKMPSGLRIATAEMPHMASVSLGIWAAVGGRCEHASQTGISHFIEHMLFKGTRRRNAAQISSAIEGIGGYLNACTSEEHTCYHTRAHHKHLGTLIDVLTDMFLRPRFDPEETGRERSVIKEEIAMTLDQPAQYVIELFDETLWPNQPLGRSLAGTPQSLDTMTPKDLASFHQKHYVSGSTVVVAAGNVHHGKLVEMLRPFDRRLVPGVQSQWFPSTNGQVRPRIRLHTQDTAQTQLALGIRACSRHDERRFALRLLNTMLGENMSSRLFQSIREEHGLAYSIYSSANYFHDTGSLTIMAGLDTGNLRKALRLIAAELGRLMEAPPHPGELRRARDYLIGQLEMSLESTESQMNWAGEHLLGYGTIMPPTQIKDRLQAVKPRHIRAAAYDFLQPDQLNLSLVSPLNSIRGFARILSSKGS